MRRRYSTSDAGLVYAHLGRRADALAEVDRIERPTDHSLTLPWMRLDPRMDPLREDACFARTWQQLYGGDLARN